MKDGLIPGRRFEYTYTVQPEHLATFMGPDVPGVLASPMMLLFMEHASREAVRPYMEPGEDTVGVGFNFEHLAATPVGMKVTTRAEVTGVEGRRITLNVEAYDEVEMIGRGTHVRALVRAERFADKIRKKTEGRTEGK